MLGGCGLYFGGGGGGTVCNEPATAKEPALEYRDPNTGQCEPFGGGGGGGGNCNPCEPCAGETGGVAVPNWAQCTGNCLGATETDCYALAGCQAEFLNSAFWGCYPVEPPESGIPADCNTTSALLCAESDTCIAVYTSSSVNGPTSFLKCQAEQMPPPPPACATLTTEADCTARTDCDPIYTGSDCTCDRNGCTCKTEVFASCQ
jgi:hypothetical protein